MKELALERRVVLTQSGPPVLRQSPQTEPHGSTDTARNRLYRLVGAQAKRLSSFDGRSINATRSVRSSRSKPVAVSYAHLPLSQ
jgi:hypothetical protein